MRTAPVIKDLVLLGGGHSHIAVLKSFGMRPIPGVRLTLISRDIETAYSGMLPGLIAGQYTFDQAHIDLVPLARFAGARFFHDEVIGIDADARTVSLADRPPVRYDLLSVNTGSTPATHEVEGADRHVVPVKPINRFLGHWKGLRERVGGYGPGARIGVVGGGTGGVELCLAVHRALTAQPGTPEQLRMELLTADQDILQEHPGGVARRFRRILAERGIEVRVETRVTRVRANTLVDATGHEFRFDEILWVTQAGAPPWLADAGIQVDGEGFMLVNDHLRSLSHADIFGAGDAVAMADHPRPKAGVFAVRQGRPLTENLRRALLKKPLIRYRPQRRFLKLIGTGNRRAVASRGPWSAEGRWVWRWKNWIDSRFMEKYKVLPEMGFTDKVAEIPAALQNSMDEDPAVVEATGSGAADVSSAGVGAAGKGAVGVSSAGTGATGRGAVGATATGADATVVDAASDAMRCGGCGAKVSADVLRAALAEIGTTPRDDVILGLDAPDDAALIAVPPDRLAVLSVDGFRSMIDDPYLFGRITANHCLGDVYAMGAEPQAAMTMATLPVWPEEKLVDELRQMLLGALRVFDREGVALVGGHTGEGAELTLGFTVTGLIESGRALRKTLLRTGDALVLTKPIGTGALLAAGMRAKVRGRWLKAALNAMLLSCRAAGDVLRKHGAHACTDITGFGLAGHLLEMLGDAPLGARIDLDALPVLPGALETIETGFLSTLQPKNERFSTQVQATNKQRERAAFALLFDPQTAGGLLAGVPRKGVETCIADLSTRGYPDAAVIGEIVNMRGQEKRIRLASA